MIVGLIGIRYQILDISTITVMSYQNFQYDVNDNDIIVVQYDNDIPI